MTRKRISLLIPAATLAGLGGLTMGVPAGAAPPASPLDGLPTTTYIASLGLTKVVRAPVNSSSTGAKGCPNGAQEEVTDTAGKTGVVAVVYYCNSTADVAALDKVVRKSLKPSSVKAPKALGSSAVQSATDAPNYLIYWTQGKQVCIVGFDTNVSSKRTGVAKTPMTAAQQKTLQKLAIEEHNRLK